MTGAILAAAAPARRYDNALIKSSIESLRRKFWCRSESRALIVSGSWSYAVSWRLALSRQGYQMQTNRIVMVVPWGQ